MAAANTDSISAPPPLEMRLLDYGVIGFAGWTVVCNVSVALGATFHQLLKASGATALLFALGWALWCVWRRRRPARSPSPPIVLAAPENIARKPIALLLASIVAACLVIAALHGDRTGNAAWFIMIVFFGSMAWLRRGGLGLPATERETARHTAAFLLLIVPCVAVTVLANAPNYDDCFYVNLSVAAVDHPDAPLLKCDTMHGQSDVPLLLPAYRVHSYELLAAAITWLTGVPAIYVQHLVLPPLGAVFCCLAWSKLLRLLFARRWVWVLAAVLCLYLFVGSPSRWLTKFAFLGMHVGKALLVTGFVPLWLACVIELFRRPCVRTWGILLAAQIAGVGASSTGIWLAPVVVGLATLSIASVSLRTQWKLAAYALASTSYVLALAIWLKAGMATTPPLHDLFTVPEWPFQYTTQDVLGAGLLRDTALFTLLVAWYFCPTPVAEKLCLLYPLGALLTLLNPFAAGFVVRNITSGSTYWRSLWVLPLPLFLGIVAAWPVLACEHARVRRFRLAAFLGMLLFLILVVAPQPALSTRKTGTAEFQWPGLNVNEGYEVARRVVGMSSPEDYVLTPEAVAIWLPTIHHHPRPLVTRRPYAFLLDGTRPFIEHAFDKHLSESFCRCALEAHVSGIGRDAVSVRLFDEALRRPDLTLVCVRSSVDWVAEIRSALQQAGYRGGEQMSGYEFWVRDQGRTLLPGAN